MSTGMSEILKNFISDTVKKIVDNPKDIVVDVSVSTKNVIVQINLNKKDCGKIIGKQGRTIEALKIIVLAIKNTSFPGDTRKVSIEILEDENSNYLRLKNKTEDK